MTQVLRYETAGMSKLRELATTKGHTNEEVDTFQAVLISLELMGFTLVKQKMINPIMPEIRQDYRSSALDKLKI